MPNRWIKEKYCASSRINSVVPEARDLWVRLLVNADDYGYFHGDAQLVASFCFPLQPNARKCEQLLAVLETARLIVRYVSGGKKYLAMCQWYERPRSKPRYPLPSSVICEQLLADANNCEQLQASTTTTTTTTTAPIEFGAEGWVGITEDDRAAWAAAYPAISIDLQLAKAKAWVVANPKNRKGNWRRFLVGWFSRAQDKAPAQGGGRKTGSTQVAV